MNTNEVANLTGISVRTLHHYDQIKLLSPDRNPANGYRVYSEEDLDQLQQILFFKACGFSLATIRQMLNSPVYDRKKAFELQRNYLLHEKKRIDRMLSTLSRTIRSTKGETEMTQKEKFDGFDMSHNPYEEEARRLWGDKAVDESNARVAAMSETEQKKIAQEMDNLFHSLAAVRSEKPNSESAQKAMEKMYQHFNQNFGNHYTPELFAGVGKLYVTDERFTKNVDKYGEGLSVFLAEAMQIYAENQT